MLFQPAVACRASRYAARRMFPRPAAESRPSIRAGSSPSRMVRQRPRPSSRDTRRSACSSFRRATAADSRDAEPVSMNRRLAAGISPLHGKRSRRRGGSSEVSQRPHSRLRQAQPCGGGRRLLRGSGSNCLTAATLIPSASSRSRWSSRCGSSTKAAVTPGRPRIASRIAAREAWRRHLPRPASSRTARSPAAVDESQASASDAETIQVTRWPSRSAACRHAAASLGPIPRGAWQQMTRVAGCRSLCAMQTSADHRNRDGPKMPWHPRPQGNRSGERPASVAPAAARTVRRGGAKLRGSARLCGPATPLLVAVARLPVGDRLHETGHRRLRRNHRRGEPLGRETLGGGGAVAGHSPAR